MDQTPVERLDSLADLANVEDHVLRQIAATPHGPLLFLSDPGRFLTEAGFQVGPGLQKELDDLPGAQENSPGSYDDVRAGKGPAATWRVRIRSLGLTTTKLDQRDPGRFR
jgi:hypothetical protein